MSGTTFACVVRFLGNVRTLFGLSELGIRDLGREFLENKNLVENIKDDRRIPENEKQFSEESDRKSPYCLKIENREFFLNSRLIPVFLNWGLKHLRGDKNFHQLVHDAVHLRCRAVLAKRGQNTNHTEVCATNALEILYGASEFYQIVRPVGYFFSKTINVEYDAKFVNGVIPIIDNFDQFTGHQVLRLRNQVDIDSFDVYRIPNLENYEVYSRLTPENIAEMEIAAIRGDWVMFRTGLDKLPTMVGIQNNAFYTACSIAVRHQTIIEMGHKPGSQRIDPKTSDELKAFEELDTTPAIWEVWDMVKDNLTEAQIAAIAIAIEAIGSNLSIEQVCTNYSLSIDGVKSSLKLAKLKVVGKFYRTIAERNGLIRDDKK